MKFNVNVNVQDNFEFEVDALDESEAVQKAEEMATEQIKQNGLSDPLLESEVLDSDEFEEDNTDVDDDTSEDDSTENDTDDEDGADNGE